MRTSCQPFLSINPPPTTGCLKGTPEDSDSHCVDEEATLGSNTESLPDHLKPPPSYEEVTSSFSSTAATAATGLLLLDPHRPLPPTYAEAINIS